MLMCLQQRFHLSSYCHFGSLMILTNQRILRTFANHFEHVRRWVFSSKWQPKRKVKIRIYSRNQLSDVPLFSLFRRVSRFCVMHRVSASLVPLHKNGFTEIHFVLNNKNHCQGIWYFHVFLVRSCFGMPQQTVSCCHPSNISSWCS